MALIVRDANIFIDFEAGGLLNRVFELPEDIAVPDVLFEEELRARHENLLGLGLRCLVLRPGAVDRAVELADRYRRPSRIDLTALALAEQERCALLTGDRFLRDAAKSEGVEVHGTLWLMERLLDAGLVNVATAGKAYARMRTAERRLPWDEVERQVGRMQGR